MPQMLQIGYTYDNEYKSTTAIDVHLIGIFFTRQETYTIEYQTSFTP